jgi:hypothetical protein
MQYGQSHFDQLDELGYTVFPAFLDLQTTRRIREHTDSLLPPILPAHEQPEQGRIRTLRHPIPGAIMPELASRPRLIDLAMRLLRIKSRADLRLLEQVLIRTDPKPPPHGPGGWHVDMAFWRHEYDASPRQTYFHMVHACSTVKPGGGAFMIVPGSHKRTFAYTATVKDIAGLSDFRGNAEKLAGVDTAKAIEVPANEGDVIVFNPMALHSASGNASDTPRYVYFASFMDASAKRLDEELAKTNYRSNFPDSLREGLPADLKQILD